MRRRRDRWVLITACVGYLLIFFYLVLWPEPDTPTRAVVWVAELLQGVGLADGEDYVEVALNVVLFVPLGLLGVWLWRMPWWAWGVVGLGISSLLEGFQWAFLPDRSPTVSDLAANTVGALAGGLIGAWVVRAVRQRPAEEVTTRPRGAPRR